MTDEKKAQPEAAASEHNNGPQFAIQKLYIKDASFEAPNSPEIFNQNYQPKVSMEINSKSRQLDEKNYEIVLTITVKAEMEDKIAFIAEAQQAGIFVAKGFNEQQLQQVINVAGPEIMFPYIREYLSSLIGKGGFPNLYLTPINFLALYQAKQAQVQQQAEQNLQNTSESIN